MNKIKLSAALLVSTALMICLSATGFAHETISSTVKSIVEVQQYNRAIHIMAMLLVGFGFLMVCVKRYGRSALTATFLLVSVSLPLYFVICDLGIFHHGEVAEIEKLILSEFAAASLLIAAGAVLGRLKMNQYILMAVLFVPAFMLNEWIVLDNGLGLLKGGFADTGGSIIIHAFGALFGLGVAVSIATKKDLEVSTTADATSDRYSMLGSMVLWLFWPSFCAALVPVEAVPYAVVNVFLALCASTVMTYIVSVKIRGKICIEDIANAALAGGVAIGSTVDHANHITALIIGALAGGISTFAFAVIQEKQQNFLKAVDTCGVTNLHGIPGILGGLAAIFVVDGLGVTSQLTGLVITIVSAIVFGLIAGKIIAAMGQRSELYEDGEEFEDVEEYEEEKAEISA